jgi:RimJ/RimL family protein N-acetyltransferase
MSLADVLVRPLQPEDVYSFRDLRLEALQQHPASFASSVSEWEALSIDEMAKMLSRQTANVVFGAFACEFEADSGLVGIIGCLRQTKEKYRHKAMVWGMYVDPEWNGKGIGRALLERVIEHAREQLGLRQLHLTVTRGNPAQGLYERMGFRGYGLEPRALHVGDGDYRDEVLMVLDLLD